MHMHVRKSVLTLSDSMFIHISPQQQQYHNLHMLLTHLAIEEVMVGTVELAFIIAQHLCIFLVLFWLPCQISNALVDSPQHGIPLRGQKVCPACAPLCVWFPLVVVHETHWRGL